MKEYFDKYDKEKYFEEKDDYIEVYGGDGSILKAIHKFKDYKKPFFGIAAGTVNFLMNKEREISTKANKLRLRLISVLILKADGTTEKYQAFNDIVIGSFNGWINFKCYDNDNLLGVFNGSGLIISTAQGSTGINKNNNGTILPLSSLNWSVTGMQCDRVINYVIEPETMVINSNSREMVEVNVDGKNIVVKDVISVILDKGNYVEVIFNNFKEFKSKRRI